jgi:hypothetical protein
MIRPSPEKVGKLGDKIGGVLKYGYPQIIPNWTNLVLKAMVFWATSNRKAYGARDERGLGWAFQELAREGWWSWALWFTPT